MKRMKHYSEALDTVLFQRSWEPVFRTLSDEDAGKLIKGIYQFMDGEEPKFENAQLEAVFLMIVKQLEGSSYRYLVRSGAFDDEEVKA